MSISENSVCIIGAGPAGIAAAYALLRADIPFRWFEGGSAPGGLWRYNNDSGLAAVYASLITNTSRPNMEWFGFSMPAASGGYLSHGEVLAYLEWFIDHTGLRDRITLATRVTCVDPLASGAFRVTAQSRDGEPSIALYRAAIVAHGRNWSPFYPSVPGEFCGSTMHAFDYKTSDVFASRRVVVAGFGNSGVDIVCDAAEVGGRAVLSTRAGGYLLSRYVGGRPRDQHSHSWALHLPRTLRTPLARLILLRRGLSPKVRAALESRARFSAKPPVISDRIAALIDEDRVTVRPAITRLDGHRVFFSDGTDEECDVLVWATGYRTVYPFFAPEVLDRNGHFRDRYLRVVPPDQPGVYFIGNIALAGPVFPVLERQALWVADLLAGRCGLPRRDEMIRLAKAQSRHGARLFPETTRSQDNVEFHPYLLAVRKAQSSRP